VASIVFLVLINLLWWKLPSGSALPCFVLQDGDGEMAVILYCYEDELQRNGGDLKQMDSNGGAKGTLVIWQSNRTKSLDDRNGGIRFNL